MLDQMYADFTTKVLPQIQEGLTITQTYFEDLFGRYVKYLIIIDSVSLALSVLGFTVIAAAGIILTRVCLRKISTTTHINRMDWQGMCAITIMGTLSFCGLLLGSIITNGKQLAKDIYIPEVRVYEEITSKLNN